MQDEAQVISQVRAGNTDAFTEIVERYQGLIIRYLHRLTGEYEVALDLAQDTFVRAYQGILKTESCWTRLSEAPTMVCFVQPNNKSPSCAI